MTTKDHLNLLYPDFSRKCQLILFEMERLGTPMRIIESLRPFHKQKDYYEIGRITNGMVVTNAKEGYSYHHYGVAADFVFRGKDPYPDHESWVPFIDLVKKFGLVSGATFKDGKGRPLVDRPHVQNPYGLRVSSMLELFCKGGLKLVWATFDKNLSKVTGKEWLDVVGSAETFIGKPSFL